MISFKRTKAHLIWLLSTLFLVSQLFYALTDVLHFAYPDEYTPKGILFLSYFSIFVYESCKNCALWLYAVKYWATAMRLSQPNLNDQSEIKFQIVLWAGLFINVLVPLLFCCAYTVNEDTKRRRELVAYCSLYWIEEVISLGFLAWAMVIIKRVLQKTKLVNIEAMSVHLLAFLLCLLAALPFNISLLRSN